MRFVAASWVACAPLAVGEDAGPVESSVNASSSGSELRHFRRTRLPLRSQLCP
ncbi:MAG: hypothetical protein JNM69_37920 [Archangium sp.]|nr:hypothetical protein [Archangium sp.]